MGATKFNFWSAALARRKDRRGISPDSPGGIRGVGGDEEAGNGERRAEGDSGRLSGQPEVDPAGIFGDFSDDEEVNADDGPEEAPIKIPREPGDPTPEEFENHCVTHLPHRPWCEVCIRARGKEEAHRRKTRDEDGTPIVSIDYKAFGATDSDEKITTMVIKD